MLVVDIGMVAQNLKMDNFAYRFLYKAEMVSIVTIFQMYSDVNISFDIFVPIYCAKRWSSTL